MPRIGNVAIKQEQILEQETNKIKNHRPFTRHKTAMFFYTVLPTF